MGGGEHCWKEKKRWQRRPQTCPWLSKLPCTAEAKCIAKDFAGLLFKEWKALEKVNDLGAGKCISFYLSL